MNQHTDREQEYELFIRQEQEKIDLLAEGMENCNQISKQMLKVLSGFEEKLCCLEGSMLAIHRETQSLTTAQKNIQASIASTKEVAKHYALALEPIDVVEARNISDQKAYLEWVDSVVEASRFFLQDKDLMDVERVGKRVKDSMKKAKEDCLQEFNEVMTSHSQPSEINRDTWNSRSSFITLPPNQVTKLASILSTMSNAGYLPAFVDELQASRSTAVKQTLKKVVHESINPLGDEKLERHVGRYQKNSHKAVFYIRFFLRLLQQEYDMLKRLFQPTPIKSLELHQVFMAIVDQPLEYFLKRLDLAIREKSPNRPLILLDVIEVLHETRPLFERVLKTAPKASPVQINKLLDIRNQVEGCLSKSVSEYHDYVTHFKGETKAQRKLKDGTIYGLTIETLGFIKKLNEYRQTLDQLPASSLPAGVSATEGSLTSNLIMLILDALETNLEAKARALNPDSLAAIFLMNNYYDIQKRARRGELQIDKKFMNHFNDRVNTARHNYRRATWDKATHFLDITSAQQAKEKFLQNKSNRKLIKAKFKGFNEVYEELFHTQREYSVPDAELRAQLRAENVEYIVPRYRAFLALFEDCEFAETNREKYQKYTVGEMEKVTNQFFDEA